MVRYKEGLVPFVDSSEANRLLQEIRERTFPLATQVNPRVFNLWKKVGLIDIPYPVKGREWIKLNFIDYIWLKIIVGLRKFGCSLENIKAIKDVCLRDYSTELARKMPELLSDESLLQSMFEKNNSLTAEGIKKMIGFLKSANFSEAMNEALGKPMTVLEMMIINMIITKSTVQIVITPSDYIESESPTDTSGISCQ